MAWGQVGVGQVIGRSCFHGRWCWPLASRSSELLLLEPYRTLLMALRSRRRSTARSRCPAESMSSAERCSCQRTTNDRTARRFGCPMSSCAAGVQIPSRIRSSSPLADRATAHSTPVWVFADSLLLDDRDIIIFEQRGNRYAEPALTCDPLRLVGGDAGAHALPGRDPGKGNRHHPVHHPQHRPRRGGPPRSHGLRAVESLWVLVQHVGDVAGDGCRSRWYPQCHPAVGETTERDDVRSRSGLAAASHRAGVQRLRGR